MISQVHCEYCGHDFESEVADITVTCPACSRATHVTPPNVPAATEPAPTSQPDPSPPPVIQPSTPANHQIISNILCAGIILLLLLIWQRQKSAPMRWEYRTFKWDSTQAIASYSDSKVIYRQFIIFKDTTLTQQGTNFEFLSSESDPQMVFTITGILCYIGADGWEFCWTDGTNYIIKRPIGTGLHATFDLEYRAETNK